MSSYVRVFPTENEYEKASDDLYYIQHLGTNTYKLAKQMGYGYDGNILYFKKTPEGGGQNKKKKIKKKKIQKKILQEKIILNIII